jgi:hypothetical protein
MIDAQLNLPIWCDRNPERDVMFSEFDIVRSSIPTIW